METTAYTVDQREEAYAIVRDAIAAGQQAIIAFPVRRGQEDILSPLEARRIGEMLEANYFPGLRFGVFSGAMSRIQQVSCRPCRIRRLRKLMLSDASAPRVQSAMS